MALIYLTFIYQSIKNQYLYLILSVQPACTHSIRCMYNTYQAYVLKISVGCIAPAEPWATRARLRKIHYMLNAGNETAPCASAMFSVASSVGQRVRNCLALNGQCRQCRGTVKIPVLPVYLVFCLRNQGIKEWLRPCCLWKVPLFLYSLEYIRLAGIQADTLLGFE